MTYSEELKDAILRTVGVDPLDCSVNQIRQRLEEKVEQAEDMVMGHIGARLEQEDIIITSTENNILYSIKEVHSMFMCEYEQFLEKE